MRTRLGDRRGRDAEVPLVLRERGKGSVRCGELVAHGPLERFGVLLAGVVQQTRDELRQGVVGRTIPRAEGRTRIQCVDERGHRFGRHGSER